MSRFRKIICLISLGMLVVGLLASCSDATPTTVYSWAGSVTPLPASNALGYNVQATNPMVTAQVFNYKTTPATKDNQNTTKAAGATATPIPNAAPTLASTPVVPTIKMPPTVAGLEATPTAASAVVNAAPVGTLNPNRPLNADELQMLKHLRSDWQSLNDSINRLSDLMTDTHPEDPQWFVKVNQEIKLWSNTFDYYKNTPMPGRVGSLIAPVWLAALEHLSLAGPKLIDGYQQSDGILVSQGDQQVGFAELQLQKTGELLAKLNG